jgi:hypothetical protein
VSCQARNLLSGMSRMGAKTRFKEAVKRGLDDVAADAAACMLQVRSNEGGS